MLMIGGVVTILVGHSLTIAKMLTYGGSAPARGKVLSWLVHFLRKS